jgi:hypothetical protein
MSEQTKQTDPAQFDKFVVWPLLPYARSGYSVACMDS